MSDEDDVEMEDCPQCGGEGVVRGEWYFSGFRSEDDTGCMWCDGTGAVEVGD